MGVLSPAAVGGQATAFTMAALSDEVIKTVVAVLTLVAAAVVVLGLGRALLGRRRPQVVIEDVVAVEGMTAPAAGLSPQLRQAVRQALLQESRNASYAVLDTLDQDIKDGLLRAYGSVQVKTISTGLRSTAEDSLTVLAAGLRAVAAKEAEGLLAALGAALPAQRGWAVRVFPVIRGTRSRIEVGVVAELAELGHPPDAVTTFWCPPENIRSKTDAAREAVIQASLYRLLEPTALWIATRLVARQLARSSVPRRWRVLYRTRLSKELAGLQMQFAGQLSLYATRKQKEFDRGFAQQALADLSESAQRLPEYFRPLTTQAAVHERLGWSFRATNESASAADEFNRAIRDYDQALLLLAQAMEAGLDGREKALERINIRRAKCRLLAADQSQLLIARQELSLFRNMAGTTSRDLYNGACLYAVAIDCPDLPSDEKEWCTRYAWHLLGRSLVVGGADGPWPLVLTDVELESMSRPQRTQFCAAIKVRLPEGTPLTGQAATALVTAAMQAIGVSPPADLPAATMAP
jgi:hypothetical protein